MAVVVIEYGKPEKYRVTCTTCNSILEYVKHDIVHRSYTDYGGDSRVACHIICPVCDTPIAVEKV